MDPKFQSSFIPSRSMVGGNSSVNYPKHSSGLLSLIGTAIFVLAVIASVGVFVYEKYLERRVTGMESSLSAARESLQPDLIKELVKEDSRIDSASEIVDGHVSLSALFALLEKLTLQSVRFSSFSFDTSDVNSKLVDINMKGEALTYKSVALQESIFSENPNIISPLFYDLDLNDDGDVTFSFKAKIDPEAISFVNQIEESNLEPAVITGATASGPAASEPNQ
ncbi:MAG: hypothetical protein A2653_00160 [Candidatus Zambryskibacteria bacterium RIFCSPHIGHO2_01_FULL_43_25]|uniref:PilN domain-containing protein n=1 Tax=Candidatus Zambryskibacteria bacterium RIFCSPLOWO2_01_FULL_45_21 TaxID=1802761 RepID=A0A1G2U6B7_9BACT|nr:MAG: hypothetical protein A2653_00160 [Candidatus Zambryskibacteria bacterium RIFCSPHIGHO2_01_FULL_43_25]OHB04462.1 MAG: hypothetical protein A3B14_03455 [Candidatus Zambryskibacteria bacterium RIFCSPLOWO2_01_FULL_45_21]